MVMVANFLVQVELGLKQFGGQPPLSGATRAQGIDEREQTVQSGVRQGSLRRTSVKRR